MGYWTTEKQLAKSPLARRPVPNANATLNAYFGFRRQQGEAINSFLVRELLTYEEFYEALLTFEDQKDGRALDGRLGLPKIEEPEYDDSNSWKWQQWKSRQGDWRRWQHTTEQADDDGDGEEEQAEQRDEDGRDSTGPTEQQKAEY